MVGHSDHYVRSIWIRYDLKHLSPSMVRRAGAPDLDALLQGEHCGPSRARLCIVEKGDQVAGTVVLVQVSERVTHVRHLWIEPAHRDDPTVYGALAEVVHEHCIDHGCLKLVVELPQADSADGDLFQTHGFCRNRTFNDDDAVRAEFYVDLYWQRNATEAAAAPAYASRMADEYLG